MAPTFHLLITTSPPSSVVPAIKFSEAKQLDIPLFEHVTKTIIHHHHNHVAKPGFSDHTQIYAFLALATLIIILLCLARILNEFKKEYGYHEIRESASDGDLKRQRAADGSDKLRGRLREIELERKREEKEELERMRERMPLLHGTSSGRSGRKSGGVGGGYCTIVEVDEEDLEEESRG